MKSSEERNECFSVMINIFTRVVTFIFLVASLNALITGNFNKIHFSVKDILGVLLMGLVSGLAFGIFYIKKNMKARTIKVLSIIYFLILNAVLFFIGISFGWFDKNFESLLTMEIMFVLVYLVVSVLVYIFDFNVTKKINQKLKDRKKEIKE